MATPSLTRDHITPWQAKQQRRLALAMVAPALVVIAIVVLYPALQTIQTSFYKWDGISNDKQFVGLDSYRLAMKGLGFDRAISNSIKWALAGMLIPPAIGLAAAALIEDSGIRFKGFFRFLFFVPYFFSMAVAGAIFTRVYDPSYGMLNQILGHLGFHTQYQWLGDQKLALWAAIVVFIWHETAFCFIIFTAAIQQIDRELYSAARIDGASPVRIFRDITLPSLSSLTTFVMSIMLIGGLTPFAVVFALTTPSLGGPYYATEILPTMIFKKGMQGTNAGQASALGVILLLLVIISTLAFMLLRKFVDRRYETE
jgi:ABC-type sugar transport system permease subunit